MADPKRVNAGDIPERLRGRVLDADPAAALDEDETPESVRVQVREMQAKARRDQFEESIPRRYAAAAVGGLHPEHQSRDVVAGWLVSESQTLFISGPVGTGKTHAGYAVLKQALEAGVWVHGCSVLDLLDYLRPNALTSPMPRIAEQCDLFLFDDLAAERDTEWAVEQFGGIIDARTREGKRQIVTTNLSYAHLVERLGRRVMSRLTGGATVIEFSGHDLRRALW